MELQFADTEIVCTCCGKSPLMETFPLHKEYTCHRTLKRLYARGFSSKLAFIDNKVDEWWDDELYLPFIKN